MAFLNRFITGAVRRSGMTVSSLHTSGRALANVRLGDVAPNFQCDTTEGHIDFHNWIGDSWTVLFSHPRAFTPVCTTELGYMAKIKGEFDRRGVKILAVSVDNVEDDKRWLVDIEETQGAAVNYPIVADEHCEVAKAYGMLSEDAVVDGLPETVRSVFIIGPDKKVKLTITYPPSTGRNFDEVLRVIDSLQMTATKSLATPVNWQMGDEAVIVPKVSDEEAKDKFPQGWTTVKPYLRLVKDYGVE
eukprot:m.166026 g.166026  ORF g.166026 m.166026 type:complete len:245 (+) comp18143_c0_seq2:66-800(+)